MTAFGVRPDALAEWEALQHALRDTRTPCMGPDSALWTSDRRGDRKAAARRCGPCAALGVCAAFATANHETHGVWGGVPR